MTSPTTLSEIPDRNNKKVKGVGSMTSVKGRANSVRAEVRKIEGAYTGNTMVQYDVWSGYNMVQGLWKLDEETNRKQVLDRAVAMMIEKLAGEIANDLKTHFKRLWSADIKKATAQYLKDNKEKIMADMLKESKKQLKGKIEEIYDRYED